MQGGDLMFEDFFYDRLTKLRLNKGVSQREMSLAMGQSEGYMTKIESKVSFPSMTVFFYICEYLSVSPRDFFEEK
jgi:transcriptional regulator with XRE-family HTH domain